MQIYKAPLNDITFLLRDFLDLPNNLKKLSNLELEVSDLEMIIEEAARICENILVPINQTGDAEGCSFNNGKVTAPKGWRSKFTLLY